MIRIRPARDRGEFRNEWLHSRHTFSFGEYHDRAHLGFGVLRVLNEDEVAGGAGFGMHAHANMEILSFVLEGRLAHRDDQGGGAVLAAGDVQWMSAGHGIRHSEFNGDDSESVHFLQVWIQTDRLNAEPAYLDRTFAAEQRRDRWCLVAAREGAGESLPIRQDVSVYVSDLAAGVELTYDIAAGRRAWLQVASGSVQINGQPLAAGDGAAVSDITAMRVRADTRAGLLLIDLPP